MIRLHTRSGATLHLAEAPDPGRECDGCTGTAEVVVHHNGPPLVELCGDCVAEGLGILLGRRHVQAGGALADHTGTPVEIKRASRPDADESGRPT